MDNYEIKIIMIATEVTTLNIYLDIEENNSVDYEMLMCINESLTEPTLEMKKKIKSVLVYFKKYFKNVTVVNKIVIV